MKYAALVILVMIKINPCSADTQARPVYTCPEAMPPATEVVTSTDRDVLLGARQTVLDFAASMDAHIVCINSAFAALVGVRQKSGGTIDPIVERSVLIANIYSLREKQRIVNAYSSSVVRYNGNLPAGSDTLPLLVVSLDPPPSDARSALPSGAPLLSMPSIALDRHCPTKLRHDGSRVLVEYDVMAEGSLANIHVAKTSGFPELDDAAITCVTTYWHNLPAIINGVPTTTPKHDAYLDFSNLQ